MGDANSFIDLIHNNTPKGVYLITLVVMPNKVIPYKKHLKNLARKLRNESTLSEVLLWKQIRARAFGVEFHRQVPIGRFIVDFYCHELKLAIEVDGCSHDGDDAIQYDKARQEILEEMGVTFIRFDDHEVKTNMQGVVQALGVCVQELLLKKRPWMRRTSL